MLTRLGTKVGTTDEMRLRSGHRVGVSGPAAKMPTSAAEARALLMRDGTRTSPPSSRDRTRKRAADARAIGHPRPEVRCACDRLEVALSPRRRRVAAAAHPLVADRLSSRKPHTKKCSRSQ